MASRILVVDDDRVSRELLAEVLTKAGHAVETAESGEDASARLAQERFPIVLSDIRMLEWSGLDLLREVKRRDPACVVVLMTGFGSMEGAIEALREGAFDYISKPFRMDELKQLLARAEKHAENLRGGGTRTETPGPSRPQTLIGKSPRIVEVYKTLARAALSSSNVLISGEAGTGKALVARAIHDNSPRKEGSFLKVSCESLGTELGNSFEALFARAAHGTLFLEEIERLSGPDQLQLMRALESDETRVHDVRLISATRLPLGELSRDGVIREDLLFALNVISFEIPPLRSRLEDLPELVGFFLAKHSVRNAKSVSHLSASAMDLLRAHEWRGNIRELEHAIEKAVALTNVAVLEPEDFPGLGPRKADEAGPAVSLEEMERNHIVRVLQETGFNKSKASEVLGIDRATLYRKAKIYGIDLRGGLRA